MGCLCPVCEEPFVDSQQCANHLAVTAILHGADHEEWLVEVATAGDLSVDRWESIPRPELAALVADRAEETDDHDHPADSPLDSTQSRPAIVGSQQTVEALDADARAILREAQELTDRMQQHGPASESEES